MEILHFEDLGDTSRLAENAVVLVLGGYQIPIAKYLRGVSTLIYNLERNPLNIFRVSALTSSGSTGGRGDAKTISPNILRSVI